MTHIKTDLPGPKARELLARDALVVSPSYPRDYPFVMSHGKGAEVWDVDGNRFLDFAAGIAVCSTGHRHPAVVQAIKDAADRFLHISSDYWHEGQIRLAERMNELAPMGEPVMSFFAQSGTESVEAALKLARYVTGRGRFLGFLGGFHGRTMGSLAFTSSKYTQQKGFFPTMPGVTHVPYPNSTSRRSCSSITFPRMKSPLFWWSPFKARAAISCRPRGSLPACGTCAIGTGYS
jgi:4-aminobutyrate aminotransferase